MSSTISERRKSTKPESPTKHLTEQHDFKEKPIKKISFLDSYNYLLETQPTITKIVSATLISISSDLLTQQIQGKHIFDLRQTYLLGFYAAFISTPIAIFEYGILEKVFKGNSFQTTLLKTMIDQLFFTWIYTIAFYSWLNFNNGGSLDFDIVVSTVKAAWTIWPIAMILIFTFVPSKLRLLAANFVGFGWGMYQSMLLEGL